MSCSSKDIRTFCFVVKNVNKLEKEYNQSDDEVELIAAYLRHIFLS